MSAVEKIRHRYKISHSLYLLPRIFRNGTDYVYDRANNRLYAYNFLNETVRIEKDPKVWDAYRKLKKKI